MVDSDSDAAAAQRPVVGYNGREHSRDALVWAAAEAVRTSTPLLVVYSANYPGMTLGPGPGLLHPELGAMEAAEEVTARGIDTARAAQPGLSVSGATDVASAAQALIRASADAALLVIGTRGFGRVLGTLLGSIAFAVAARAACPVIVVKGTGRDPAAPHQGRIVVGTDGSAQASAAVRFAADRAAAVSASLQVVTATGEHLAADVDPRELQASASMIAETTAEQLRGTHPGVQVVTRVEDSAAERTLVDASVGADLVVVGTRGRGAFKGMLLGSVSHAVIYGADCPVAVVDDAASAGAAPPASD